MTLMFLQAKKSEQKNRMSSSFKIYNNFYCFNSKPPSHPSNNQKQSPLSEQIA